ncbi:MAG: endo-1,4-beta-xylanase [Cyclobacteriaceae bacterium]
MKLIHSHYILLSCSLLLACQAGSSELSNDISEEKPTLRDAFKNDFTIGAALGASQIAGDNAKEKELIARQFSSITPENIMKWENIHPQPDSFNFELADQMVADAQKNNQQIIGHTLTWHNQTPDWLFEDENGNLVDSATLFARMKSHIETVAGRYKGKIFGWDVLNEALNEDGSYRNSKFYQISGEEYIYKAFAYANEVDPDMELYYNDYNMHRPDKVEGAIRIASNVRDRGLRIDGIGMQGHWGIDGPPVDVIEASILKIHQAGFKVMITELDIDVLPNPYNIEGADLSDNFESDATLNPYPDGLPDSVNQVHAKRYEDLFALFLKHQDKISRVTFWGVHDGHSWKNNWPARGRTNYCLVFGRDLEPKLAYEKIMSLKQ